MGKVNTVVLDKTGTLTFGRPEVQKVIPVDGETDMSLIDAAATAEFRSEHPLGQAIVAYALSRNRSVAEPDRFQYSPGARHCRDVRGRHDISRQQGIDDRSEH